RLVHLRRGMAQWRAGKVLARVAGVACWHPGGRELLLVGARPGWIVAAPAHPSGGFHGGPATARTVAIVGGGHGAVPRIASAIARRRPHLATWAGVILDLLEVQTSAKVSGDQARGVV